MPRRTTVNVRLCASMLLTASLAAPYASAQSTVALSAEAGLGGLVRPGRWAPVRITLDNRGRDIEGELTVDWGPAHVVRAVQLGSASRHQFELYLRTGDVRDAMAVRLRADGREISTGTVPVRVVGDQHLVTLCADDAVAAPATARECAVVLPTSSLPRSPRGYAAADRVLLTTADRSSLRPDQRDALRLWEAARTLDDKGLASVPMPAVPADGHVLAQAHLQLLAGGLASVVILLVARRMRRGLVLLPAVGLLTVAASAAVFAIGGVGDGSAVHVNQAATLQQFEHVNGVLLLARGSLEYPAFDTYMLRTDVSDGALHPERSALSSDERVDEDGFSGLSGSYGLGATLGFRFEGVDGRPVFESSRAQRVIRITNVSAFDLGACELSGGLSKRDAGVLRVLRPGESVDTEQMTAGDDPRLSCEFAGSPYAFTEARRPVEIRGRTAAVFHVDTADDQRPASQ